MVSVGGGPKDPGAAPAIEKREIFRGRSSQTSELKLYGLGGALFSGGLIAAVVLLVTAFPWFVALLAVILAGIGAVMIAIGYLKVISVAYRVDTMRIEIESGLLWKRIDNLELWRVKDLQYRQGLVQRMLGVADVVLHTSDATNPVVVLQHIHGARGLYDALRDAVDASRRARGVVGIETSR